jgi:hypothetical protein
MPYDLDPQARQFAKAIDTGWMILSGLAIGADVALELFASHMPHRAFAEFGLGALAFSGVMPIARRFIDHDYPWDDRQANPQVNLLSTSVQLSAAEARGIKVVV